MTKFQIAIVNDDDYLPDGDYDTEEERQKLADGEWQAYGIVALVNGKRDYCAALWGTVADSGFEGTYDSPDDISDEYLRDTAKEILEEAKQTISEREWYILAGSLEEAKRLTPETIPAEDATVFATYEDADKHRRENHNPITTEVYQVQVSIRQFSFGYDRRVK